MLEQSGVLTIMGMGTVFLFLVLVIISLTIMGKVFQRFPDKTAPGALPVSGQTAQASSKQSDVVAAITAAVTEYRKGRS
jgi:oxaloacetate decarboxylase gamma subunit